ncbi:hypothetical protein E6Q11_04660 [Candidatus Dojkabacteria bacterium]|uniref:DNA polymerase III subunit delta n=1 Tax=Candidatus Dojkabacteria bacterium TaxID=2099670 RepID=A0A5C7J4T7_9BACT|nr:MAG: hypothetical protein E6Q11_04660 [Candidatus Dojkabacteria bacterium]
MQTFIISSKNLSEGREVIEKILIQEKIDKFDIEVLEFEKDLGIEDVRNIQKKIYLKPFQGDRKASVWILSSKATNDAQNALLKLLEEPPPSCLIYILATDIGFFLPTILSRAKIIEIKDDLETNLDNLEQILEIKGAGDALFLAQVISKEKSEAIAWLEKAILGARTKMIESIEDKNEAIKFRKLIHKLELTHYDLKNTNANQRLALENLFLNLEYN